MLRSIPTILCTASLLLTWTVEAPAGPKAKARSNNARRAVARALDTFEELVESERYADAAELADDLAKAFPKNPIARLMQRQARLLAKPANDGRQLADQRRERDAKPAETKLVVATYPVADLVVAIPGMASVGIGVAPGAGREWSHEEGGISPAATPRAVDFDTLVDLLTSTVDPESWSTKNGPGTIASQETTLSLVIRQTPEVHEQVVKVLSALRRLQDVQATLELRYVEVDETFFERVGVDFDFEPQAAIAAGAPWVLVKEPIPAVPRLQPGGHRVLARVETTTLLNSLEADPRSNILSAPKVTLFNGQAARIFNANRDTEHGRLFRTVVSSDRRSVQLRMGVDSTDSIEVLHSTRDFVLKDGETLLLDDGTRELEVRQEAGVPILNKVPYVSRLFKNTGTGRVRTRRLLLVTPRVIVQEEELVPPPRVSLVTPRGVFAAEEEPLLGLDD